jgi:predicted secreted protein
MYPIRNLGLAVTAALLTLSASGQEPPVYNRIDLSASAQSEVANDLMIAVVFAETEDNDQADAANFVNAAIEWAAERARRVDGVNLQTQQYTTRPVYASGARRITGWIARQALRLEAEDAEALSELLGELQQRVAIQSLGSALSRSARDAAEENLIAEAIAAFRRRAELVSTELGHDGYRLVHLSVGTSGVVMPVREMRGLGAVAVADSFAPEIEPGEQTVMVSVSGTIELQ